MSPTDLPENAKVAAFVERALGRVVRELREARGWSQTDLASKLAALGFDYHQTTIGKLESGHRPLRVRELFAMADVLEVSVYDILNALAPQEIPSTADELVLLERESAAARTTLMEAIQAALDEYSRTLRILESRRARLRTDG